jgi:integrase/recombinase XerC
MNAISGTIKTRAGENYLTEDEEKKLFKLLRNRKDWQAERDYTLLRLARATGLRRVEICRLNVGDVRGKTVLTVDDRIAAKGAVGDVYLPKDVQALIRWFLRLKRTWGETLDDAAPLFISRKGGRLDESTVHRLLSKWCLEAGIPHYSPHAMRHTKARRILDDVKVLSDDEKARALQFANKQLRHKSWNATLIYTMPTKEQMGRVGEI